MKKKIKLLILTLIVITATGCFNDKNIKKYKITTTTYPTEYLVKEIYGKNAEIISIYPNGTNIEDYELTKKQIKDFSKKTDLFVYNSLTSEKDIAKQLLNKNKNMQLIDVAYGLKHKVKYGIEELWLSPNNYLMLANTIKNDLEELTDNKYAAQEIEENFATLQEQLSLLDAELRSIGRTAKAKGTNTLIVATNSLNFLEEYDFNIVNISSENNVTTSIKNKFKDKGYNKILISDEEETPDYIKDIVDNYEASLIKINVITTLTDSERESNDNYLSIMKNTINQISNIVIS